MLPACWFPGSLRGGKREHGGAARCSSSRGCPRNCKRRVFRPYRPLGNWEGWTQRQRPASQETCQRGHPTGGRKDHTERLFAAVTEQPMRRPCGMVSLTIQSMNDERPVCRLSARAEG